MYVFSLAQSTNAKDVRHVSVALLSGERLDVVCDTSTLGRDVFDAVVAQLGLPEHYLFALAYLQGTRLSTRYSYKPTMPCTSMHYWSSVLTATKIVKIFERLLILLRYSNPHQCVIKVEI